MQRLLLSSYYVFMLTIYIAIIILATAKYGEIQQESEFIKLQSNPPLKLSINNTLGAC